jgi:hypothetical protein
VELSLDEAVAWVVSYYYSVNNMGKIGDTSGIKWIGQASFSQVLWMEYAPGEIRSVGFIDVSPFYKIT